MVCKVTVTLIFAFQNPISSSLKPSWCLYQVWKKFIKEIMRYHVHRNGMDTRSQWPWPLTSDLQRMGWTDKGTINIVKSLSRVMHYMAYSTKWYQYYYSAVYTVLYTVHVRTGSSVLCRCIVSQRRNVLHISRVGSLGDSHLKVMALCHRTW